MLVEKTRYALVDSLRGLAIVHMVAFHFLYDVFEVYGKRPGWYMLPAVHIWQQYICWTFIFLAGFVWRWGRAGNLKRGLLLNAFGLVISVVTLVAAPDQVIWFGVLNCIGCCILLMIPAETLLKKVKPLWGLLGSFVLFLLCRHVQNGYFGMEGLFQIPLPESLYAVKILTPVGFPFPGFRSSDYFPLLPWMLLFVCGYFFHRLFLSRKRWQKIARRGIPGLSALGRKSIWIYLAHQPLSMLLCALLFRP